MTKIFRLAGVSLTTIILCLAFTSCSKFNSQDYKVKRLVNFSNDVDSPDSQNGYTFSYDNNGRLISATVTNDSIVYHNFNWEGNTITVNKTSNTGSAPLKYKIVMENNLVKYFEKENNDLCTFTYNSANKFVESSYGNYADWDGDKFIKYTKNKVECILTYGTTCENGYLPFAATLIPPSECTVLYLAHPEIGGMRTNQLPSTIDFYFAGKKADSMNFNYEFDKDGYITKIINDDVSYFLTWE